MPTIPEVVPPQPFKDKTNIVQLERKLYNTSVHKKKRSLSRKLSLRKLLARQQQDLSGITRIIILQSDNELTLQNDPGSNRNICNKPYLLLKNKKIPPIPIGGQPAIYATGRGLFPWRSNNGDVLLIEMLACPEDDCTLLSSTAIVNQYPDLFYGWNLHCNQDEEFGMLQLLKIGMELTTPRLTHLWRMISGTIMLLIHRLLKIRLLFMHSVYEPTLNSGTIGLDMHVHER